MRHRTEVQEHLYQYYLNFGRHCSSLNIWKGISKEGIWRLPIEIKEGGEGFKWDDCLSALEGIVSSFYDRKFIDKLVSHFLSLYLMSKYGLQAAKKTCISLLMKGKRIFFFRSSSDLSPTISNRNSRVNKQCETSLSDFKDEVSFFVINKCISKNNEHLARTDLVNMKKIIYGVLVSCSAYSIVDRYKKILVINAQLNDVTDNIKDAVNLLYKKFDSMVNSQITRSHQIC